MLELKVKMNILQTIPGLHFPSSLLTLLALSSSPSVSSLALLLSLYIHTLVWQRNEDLDVVEREESRLAF